MANRPVLLSCAAACTAFAVVLSARGPDTLGVDTRTTSPEPRAQQPAAGRFQPQGVKVAIPGTDNCFIYVAALKNGSWYDPASPADNPVVRSGTVIDTPDARLDVNDVTRWLEHFLQSPDMQAKAKTACQATGVNFIQIGIVRDDPRAGPGAWYFDNPRDGPWGGTPLVVLDFGDIEKLTKHVESTPMGNPDRERSARQRVAAVVPVTLFAHECDHAQRAPYILEHELAFANVRALRNLSADEVRLQAENYQKYRDDLEQKAIDDENAVILDLDEFKHTGYSRTAYHDGAGGIPFKIDGVQVRVNYAKALGSTEHRPGAEHRFITLEADDRMMLDKTPVLRTRPATTDPADSAGFHVSFTRRSGPMGDKKQDPHLLLEEIMERTSLNISKYARKTRQKLSLNDPSDANVPRVNSARAADSNQTAGGTVLTWVNNAVVMAGASPAPSLPWALRRPVVMTSIRRTPARLQTVSGSPAMKAIFIATGRSSGPAFQMTMVYDGPGPAELLDPGFVLEPVQNVTARQAEDELSRVKGRRVTATIDAYCLQMEKPPPAAGMVYRLARNAIQEQNDHLAPIMAAGKLLQTRGQLHPDSEPAEYFHSIRQWALWTHEQNFKDEEAFAKAFIDHSKKNVSAAGRRWTPELEQALRRLVPNRWRDIREVMMLALPAAGGGR